MTLPKEIFIGEGSDVAATDLFDELKDLPQPLYFKSVNIEGLPLYLVVDIKPIPDDYQLSRDCY